MGDSWIGLKKLEPYSQNNFEWSDGTPYDFTAWKDGEPNNGGPDCKFFGWSFLFRARSRNPQNGITNF